jgi:hypothetical protein
MLTLASSCLSRLTSTSSTSHLKASRHRSAGPVTEDSWRCYGRLRKGCCGFRNASVTDPRPVALAAGSAFRGVHRFTRLKGPRKYGALTGTGT